MNIITNRKFRDTNAWYHIVVIIDTHKQHQQIELKFM